MQEVVNTSFGKAGVSPTPEDFKYLSAVFARAGGSWIRLFRGSVSDVGLLKKVLKVAIDKGKVTKSPKWGG